MPVDQEALLAQALQALTKELDAELRSAMDAFDKAFAVESSEEEPKEPVHSKAVRVVKADYSTDAMLAFTLPSAAIQACVAAQDEFVLYQETAGSSHVLDLVNPQDLHITLAYLGEIDKLDPSSADKLRVKLAEFSGRHGFVTATLQGITRFYNGDETEPIVVHVDSLHIQAFRRELVQMLAGVGIEVASTHGFSPHITLAYVPQTFALTPRVDKVNFRLDNLGLYWGDDVHEYPLTSSEYIDPLVLVKKALAGESYDDIEYWVKLGIANGHYRGLVSGIIDDFMRGGSGSGNFAHAGRPGQVGGSSPADSSSVVQRSDLPSKDYVLSLSPEHKEMLENYSLFTYKPVNNFLRGKADQVNPNDVKGGEQVIEDLDRIIAQAPVFAAAKLYRALAKSPQDAGLEVGSAFIDKGYVSTTHGASVAFTVFSALNTIVHISFPKGVREQVRALYMEKAVAKKYKEEREVLLGRGNKFRVTKMVQSKVNPNRWDVYVDWEGHLD